MYKEYLAEFWNAIGAHYLAHFGEYVAPPSIDVVRQWFLTIGYGEEVSAKGTLKKSLLPLGWSLTNGINIDYANIFWEDIILKLKKKQREKVVPYTRFISLMIMHKIKEGYEDDEVTLYPTQVFSVNNWALKPNQPGEPPFIDHMLAICAVDKPVVFKAPKPSSIAERVPQGTKLGAQLGHKKQLTSLKQPSVSNKEATKGGSSKAPTGSKTGHSKKRKESSSAMDSNPSQPSISTTIDPGMHKEDHSVVSASGNDASAVSTAEANPGNSAPSDFVPQQQGINEGTKNTSFDHLFAGTGPHVLAKQTKSITQPLTGKGASSIARQVEEEEASRTIKLEDLAKLVSNVQLSFKDLDSPEDDHVIIVESDAEEEDGIHATEYVETEDTSVPKSSSPKSSLIQELTNQVLILQSQKHKLELEKNEAEAEVALLKAQPSFPNVEQLNELLVKALKTEFSKILSAHDFSSSLPIELKNIPSKFNKLTEEVKELKNQVHNLEIELSGDLKEIPTKLEDFTNTITSCISSKLKTLDTLPGLLSHVTKVLNKFAQVLDSASSKARDQGVPSAGQADTMPDEGEKNTNQATISQLFQRRTKKNVERTNLNIPQPKTTTPPPIPPVITTTITQMQSTSFQPPPKISSQPEREHIKKDKGKKDLYSEEGEKESTESGSDDETTHMPSSMCTKENTQKKIEEEAKAEAASRKGEIRKEELIDLLGPEVVKKYYNDKLQYDRYCDKMLNKREKSRITNCDILTKKGPITLKVYREDDTSEIIPEFKASDLHLGEWREVVTACPNKKDFYQGPGLDDHARTFSSLLLSKIDKRNLNPHKQMRVIEQLRQ
ncbi:hypothetical protein Tco_1076758 [Tanacetum coccineum]